MITIETKYNDLLNKIDIIKNNVTPEYINEIMDSIHIISCKKGQQFIMEGAAVNGLFFICSGKAKVLKTGIYGKEQIVRLVGEGEMVGHRGFGTREKYGICAIALEDTTLCNFPNDIMEKMLHEIPGLTYDLMLFYAEELNNSETKVKAFAQMNVREKIIDTLLYIDRKFGKNPKGYFNIRLKRKEIADYAGTSEEQVIRTISLLKKENYIIISGKQIGIVNLNALKNEISEHNFFLDT